MDTFAMDQSRLERIRLLSSRFNELQGLRAALVGACFAAATGGYVIATAVPTEKGVMNALGISVVPIVAGIRWLDHFYATTFGRQTGNLSLQVDRQLAIYFAVSFGLKLWFPESSSGFPVAAALALSLLYVAIRDWPWRGYYLGATLAIAGVLAVGASGVGMLRDPVMTSCATFLTLGISLAAVGVLDHLLLVRLMKEARVKVESPRDVGSDL